MILGKAGANGLPDPNSFVYVNSFADMEVAIEQCNRLGLGMHFAIFEPGFLRNVLSYWRFGQLTPGSFVKFYFGGPGGYFAIGDSVSFGLPPTEKALGRLSGDAGVGRLRSALVRRSGGRRPHRVPDPPAHPRAGRPPPRRPRGLRRRPPPAQPCVGGRKSPPSSPTWAARWPLPPKPSRSSASPPAKPPGSSQPTSPATAGSPVLALASSVW